jgi:hypothetical protein
MSEDLLLKEQHGCGVVVKAAISQKQAHHACLLIATRSSYTLATKMVQRALQ